jgi:hypothetical protein
MINKTAMKIFFVFFILLKCMNLPGQTNPVNKTEVTDSTGFGTPDGKLVSNQIGIAGGRIASEDGRIELIFPSGALTEIKTISIQPTTNLFDSAAGKAYRF